MFITLIGGACLQFELTKMIRIKKVKSEGFYIFQGKSSANSVFIEDISEAKEFLILANYYFKGYLKVYEYLLSKDGWIMVVKINPFDKLKNTLGLESISKEEVWRLISERVRIFLSRFVKFTNKKQGRTGSKVHSSYERFMFTSLSEAKKFINMIRNQLIKLHQTNRKYRGKKSHYKIPKKLGLGSIFISSKQKRKKIKELGFFMECLNLQKFERNVLLNLVLSTLENTQSKKSSSTSERINYF